MSSTHTIYKAANCINGKDDGPERGKDVDMCQTAERKKADPAPWIALDFGDDVRVKVAKVVLANRVECCGKRTENVEVRLSNELPPDGQSMFEGGQLLAEFAGPGSEGEKIEIKTEQGKENILGRYLIIQMDKKFQDPPSPLNLKEVTVRGKKFSPGDVISSRRYQMGADWRAAAKKHNIVPTPKLVDGSRCCKICQEKFPETKVWQKYNKYNICECITYDDDDFDPRKFERTHGGYNIGTCA